MTTDPTADTTTGLQVGSLTHSYGKRVVLREVSLSLPAGTSAAVSGPSGSGKSTLLSCVLGLIKPTSGVVHVQGRPITTLSRKAMAKFRRTHIGMVFQHGELLPELSAQDNIAVAGLIGGLDRDQAYARSQALLEDLAVPSGSVRAADLSGGEYQRVALARALVNQPAVLLADEPTGALDADLRDQAAQQLFALPGATGCALLVVTHDPQVAQRADRQYLLEHGQLRSA